MSRRIFGFSIFSALFLSITKASAVQIPPTKCYKAGQTTQYKGRLYTCVRKKIKGKWTLVWNDGVAIPIPTKTPSPASIKPTPISSSTPTPSPSYKQIEKIEIKVAESKSLAVGKNISVSAINRYGNLTGYVLYRGSKGLIAMSDICQHKGCSVIIDKSGLLCPCHNALFDNTNGEVLRGPASYPLDRVESFERDGAIFVID